MKKTILATLCGLLFFGPPLFASDVPRKILAFYDPKMNSDYNYSAIHLNAAMPLEYLGLMVEPRSISDPLPSAKEMEGVRGILTWFNRFNAVSNPKSYCEWMEKQLQQGKKVVIFGELGVFKDKKRSLPRECRGLLRGLGIQYFGGYSDNPLFYEMAYKDPAMVEFERKFSFSESNVSAFYKAIFPSSKVYLKIRRKDLEDKASDMVFTTPHGGFAAFTTPFFENKEIGKSHWRLNPFLFFEEAFDVKGLPRPDATTLNGRRIFYTHIDGDGIVNLSHIDWKSFSGEIILKEILQKYPDLPFTVSLITGYFDMSEYQSARVTKLYRELFSLPNVEAGVHGYAHPLIWKKGTVALKIPGYTFSPVQEIEGAAKRMQSLLEQQKIDKKADIYLWTGDCIVNETEVGLTYQNNLLNINGGDARFDRLYDSYAFVGPLGIKRGPYRQIYASAQNENTYTNLWEGPYYGFIDVIETLKNTGSPLRIKPIDVYYHFYSGERQASLKALRGVYDYALAQKIFPIFAGDFSRIVKDFYATKIETLAGGGYRIANEGKLKTIRFDREKRSIDWQRSRGILGFHHEQGSLYVHLDETKEHTLYLTTADKAIPYLEEATFEIKDFKRKGDSLSFAKSGWFKSEMVLGGMVPGRTYQIVTKEGTFSATSDKQGRLAISFKNVEKGPTFANVTVKPNR